MSAATTPAATTVADRPLDAVIVGGGPRGVATVLRLAARAEAAAATGGGTEIAGEGTTNAGGSAPRPVRVALVDVCEIGPGATWTTAQTGAYLNNTQAAATTIHPDASTRMSGPARPGPDLVDWAREVVAAGGHPAGAWVLAEARALEPASFPSRRLQGVYYRDQLDRAIASGTVEVDEHRDLAIALEVAGAADADADDTSDIDGAGDGDIDGGLRTVVLRDGTRLTAPTVVLAQGMVQARPSAEVRGLAAAAERAGLRYVAPGMPAERVFTDLPAGQTVLVRGLGANSFDVMGQLAEHWGGRFEAVPGDPHGRLRYVPSGREARLVVGSRRGAPYRSKPDGGLPVRPFAARWATPELFDALRERGRVDLRQEVWPVLAREFARCYLEALAEHAPAVVPPAALARALAQLDAARTAEEADEILAETIDDERWAWSLAELESATSGALVDEDGWARIVGRLVDDELGSLAEPATHPRAAVNGAMGALRGHVGRLAGAGAFTGASLARDVLGWFDACGLSLASGPPADRTRAVLAMIEAGVIDLLGPALEIGIDEDGTGAADGAGTSAIDGAAADGPAFTGRSAVTGRSVRARTLLETRMSKGRVPETDDPLLRGLLDAGRARVHTVDGVPTHSMEATGAEISEDAAGGHNLVAADGTVDPAVVVLGIPAQSTQPGSAIGATPGKPSPLLAGADVAARQVLRRRREVGETVGERAVRSASPR
ncbi:FAD/NAD(P)-binding protein [Brachybacterium sp. DNPG3]